MVADFFTEERGLRRISTFKESPLKGLFEFDIINHIVGERDEVTVVEEARLDQFAVYLLNYFSVLANCAVDRVVGYHAIR